MVLRAAFRRGLVFPVQDKTTTMRQVRFMERFVPMSCSAAGYRVLLRGGIEIPREEYGHLYSTEECVSCCYRYRNYGFNRPTYLGVPLLDESGRPYVLSWNGFCVWSCAPKKVYRVYHVEGETLYLKSGSSFYKSHRHRPPVLDRTGVSRRISQLLGEAVIFK